MLRIEVSSSDIFSLEVDAMVNPALRQATLSFGSHICEHIKKTAGQQVIRERKEKGKIKMGEAVLTKGGDLSFKYIIHAAVLNMFDMNFLFLLKIRQRTSDETLRNATRNSLKAADECGKIESLAFSPMGAGHGGMSMEKCASIMLGETISFSNSKPDSALRKVVFAVREEEDGEIFTRVLGELQASK